MNFDFDSNLEKLRSFLFVKRKASINAIQYVRNLPIERTIAKRFSQDIFPSSVDSTAKVVNYFELSKKSCFFFVVFKAVYGDQCLIKVRSTASEVKGIVRLLCVYCPSIVRE